MKLKTFKTGFPSVSRQLEGLTNLGSIKAKFGRK